MAVILAAGTIVQFASAYAGPLAFTTNAGSNAAEALLPMASTTGLAAGDAVELTSGWGALNGRLVRLKAVTANTSVVLEEINTTDTVRFPQNAGNGTLRKVNTWTQITQLSTQISVSGGDQEFADTTFLEDRLRKRAPTVRGFLGATMEAFFDPALGWYPLLRAISEASAVAGFLMVYPNGARTMGSGNWSLLDVPTINDNTLRTKIDLAYAAPPQTYRN